VAPHQRLRPLRRQEALALARDLDFLRDEERAPLAYDDARYGFRLTDETYTLPPVL
jgi:hypothetical protein